MSESVCGKEEERSSKEEGELESYMLRVPESRSQMNAVYTSN